MKLDDDISNFFSEGNHLRQIDRLHGLLFDLLEDAEAKLEADIRAAIQGIGRPEWMLRVGKPQGSPNYTHLGLVQRTPGHVLPADAWVHFGWEGNLLAGGNAWIGVYTGIESDDIWTKLQSAMRLALANSVENEFGVGDPYVVYKNVPGWPMVTGWDGRSITRKTKLDPLADLLADRGTKVVDWIGKSLGAILDSLNHLERENPIGAAAS